MAVEDQLIDQDESHMYHRFERVVRRSSDSGELSQTMICKISVHALDGTKQHGQFQQSHPEVDYDHETSVSAESLDTGCRVQICALLEPPMPQEDYSDLQQTFDWCISENCIVIATALRDTLLDQ